MPLERLGKYEIEALVGKGAMGEVFKAKDPVLKRPVAIKIIAAALVSDEQFRQRFLQEARSAAQLNHRNIVTVYEFNEQQEQVFLVMEFLEGTDLREAIARRTLTRLDDKLAVIEQVCDGLGYAHRKGIVHRDLKPANIRLLPNLSPKIMDFGLARLGTSEITRAGTVMGTPDYMAPEQVRAEKVDARADIFSVGAVLYHLLSGRKPFESASVHSILYDVLERDPVPLQSVAPDLPPLVIPIVERALQKDPAKRFDSALAMRDALRDARRAIAAGRAAAAALIPGSEGEATITRMELPSYPSMSAASLPTAPAASVPPRVGDLPPSLPTLVAGATALDLSVPANGEASTARPQPTLVGSSIESPPPAGRGLLVGAAAATLLLAGLGFAALRWLHPAGPSPEELAQQREGMLREALAAELVELARTELQNKEYDKALKQAEDVLARDPGNAEAQEVLTGARDSLTKLDEAAREARSAFQRHDTDAASLALGRVLALDPHHKVATELQAALNQHFRSQAEDARKGAERARRSAEGARAGSQPTFLAAHRATREAEGLFESGHFVEAAQKFAEAGDGFDRARRDSEAAAAAAARPSPVLPSASSPPERSAVLPSPLLAFPVGPAAPPLSPPSPAPAASLPSLPPVAQPLAPSSQEPAVRRLLADYARALQSQDLALFKTVMPRISAEDEKRLRESFKNIKYNRVDLSPGPVQFEGSRATVKVARQDTINGQEQRPRQQTFRLVQTGGTWTIESIGQ